MANKSAPFKGDISAEKTLFDVLRDLWAARLYMGLCAIVAVAMAFAFIAFARDYYRAEMLLAPAVPMGQGLHASSAIGEGSAQIQPDELQSAAAFLKFEHIYDGESVASILVGDEEMLSALAEDRMFEFSAARGAWTPEKLSAYLGKQVRLEPVSGTQLRKLSYYHPNAEMAKAVIAKIHRVTDEIIRARILREVSGRIDYLNQALSKTNNPQHRRSFADLLMEQERLKMMVSLDAPFAASIIEPPSVSARPKWPDPYLIYPIFLCVGLLLGFVAHGLRHSHA